MDFRIGNGYDVHQLAEGLQLVLCGVKIPHSKGCVAHSDGDAAIHAICDAMLGALALGDIGHHFPDNDPAYSGIDSRILLRRVNALVAERGWKVVNIDCTILLQKPKVAPYIELMRETLAEDLFIASHCVSVKATTTERLGFVGREEGVAAQATVLLQRL